jgi:hypothetical protein
MKRVLIGLALGWCLLQSVIAQDQGGFVGTNWFGSLYINPKDDSSAGWLFAITPSGTPSGVSGCPTAREFFFRTNVPSANAMWSALLYARSTNRQVYFAGYCQVDTNRFRIAEVIVGL